VRVGGPNSGHTVVDEHGEVTVFRHLPTACLIPGLTNVIPPGSYLNVEVLMREIARAGQRLSRLVIDPHAWIVTQEDVARESTSGLTTSIGSTGSGMVYSFIRRFLSKVS
jgi:adenylosuccinate synthase